MIWDHPLFRRQAVQFRLIQLIMLIATWSAVFFVAGVWLGSPRVPVISPAETKAKQAALMKYSTDYGHDPIPARIIKAIKLEGTSWIVQIIEVYNPEPSGLRVVNTFHVDSNSSCQWLGVNEWGSY
jgi:hypothetical protein